MATSTARKAVGLYDDDGNLVVDPVDLDPIAADPVIDPVEPDPVAADPIDPAEPDPVDPADPSDPGQAEDPFFSLDQPGWFDEQWFMEQKIVQMNAMAYHGRTDWDEAGYNAELEAFNCTAWQNFQACNLSASLPEIFADNADPYIARMENTNVSPNAYFNEQEYLLAVAKNANETGYVSASDAQVQVEAGQWTASTVLEHMLKDFNISAWDHFTGAGQRSMINPSNDFDIRAFFEAQAQQFNTMVDYEGNVGYQGRTDWTPEAIAELNAEMGVNPVMRYQTLGIEPTAVAEGDAVEPDPDWTPWGEYAGGLPVEPENPQEEPNEYAYTNEVQIEAGNTGPYDGVAGENTLFSATWSATSEESTLSPDDVVNGGEDGRDTLAITLDSNWKGFNTREDGGANVQNVGRIELSHSEGSENAPIQFSAAGISGAKEYSLVANGSGAINVSNIADAEAAIRIEGLTGENQRASATTISFAKGVVDGDSDSTNLILNNVGSAQSVDISMTGIENLAISSYNDNSVNLSGVEDARAITASGPGSLAISGVGEAVASFDAAEAKGSVYANLANSKVLTDVKGGAGDDSFVISGGAKAGEVNIDGGEGFDTVILARGANLSPVWANIEAVQVNNGAATINAENMEGFAGLNVGGAGVSAAARNVNAETFTVKNLGGASTTIAAASTVRISGEIGDLKYEGVARETANPMNTSLISESTGDVDITLGANVSEQGSFDARNATGEAALTVGEGGTFSGTLGLGKTSSFTADIQGTLNNATLNVVDDPESANPRSIVDLTLANGGVLVLNADGATELSINAGNNVTFSTGTSLQNVETFSLSQDNGEFNGANANLQSAMSVQVQGNGEEGTNVVLGNIGSNSSGNELLINVDSVDDFTAGNLAASFARNLTANISAYGDVSLGKISTESGNISLGVYAETLTAGDVSGGDVNIDAFNVNGDVALGTITAETAATVTGSASGATNLHVVFGESAQLTGGSANDVFEISSSGAYAKASLAGGDGADTFIVNAASQGVMGVSISDYGYGGVNDTIEFNAGSLSSLGIDLASGQAAQTKLADIINKAGFGASANGFEAVDGSDSMVYDSNYGNLYAINHTGQAWTVVQVAGVDMAIFTDIPVEDMAA